MTVTISTTRRKPRPDSMVGIAFKSTSDGKLIITTVNPTGLFRRSALTPGFEIVSINEMSVRGMTATQVQQILASIETDVTIRAASLSSSAAAQQQSYRLSIMIDEKQKKLIYEEHHNVSLFLQSMNVSTRKWNRVQEIFESDLVPVVQNFLVMDVIWRKEIEEYVSKQMSKGSSSWNWLESKHERKTFMMAQQVAIQHSNIAMVANNVLTKVNALLNIHGVMAELEFTMQEMPKFSHRQNGTNKTMIPTGIQFTAIDDDYEEGSC